MSKLDELNKLKAIVARAKEEKADLPFVIDYRPGKSLYEHFYFETKRGSDHLMPYMNRAALRYLPKLLLEAERLMDDAVNKATEAAREEALEVLASTHKKAAPDAQ